MGYRLQIWKRDPESYATDLHGLHYDIFVYVSFWTDFGHDLAGEDPGFIVGGGSNPLGGGANIQIQ